MLERERERTLKMEKKRKAVAGDEMIEPLRNLPRGKRE